MSSLARSLELLRSTVTCSHCLLPFSTPEALTAHQERNGHGKPTTAALLPSARCSCGSELLTPVSLDSRLCLACRWDARHTLGAASLRLLAASFRRQGLERQARNEAASASDYFAEANACEEEASAREVGHV